MDIAAPAPATPLRLRRFSFLGKLLLAIALVAFADHLFFLQRAGATLGVYAAALLVAVLAATPAIGRSGPALAAAGAALLFALALADDPSLLAALLFLAAAALAVLLPRTAVFDDGWRWTQRLLIHLFLTPLAPALDWMSLRRARRRRPARLAALLPLVALPILGSALFLALFSAANPLIAKAFERVDLLVLVGGVSIARLGFWAAAALLVWSLLRPPRARLLPAREREGEVSLPGVSPASVALSLAAFNAVFALQNGLDIAFLWSGAPLPEGVTLAEYAHRGAYPLIATALLAALFVLVTLRPGSATAASPLVRRLVYAWIAQNLLLVASTVLRTLDYVEAYSLTRLRIAALVWMVLVAIGLVLICVRIWRRRSGAWLINANLAFALVALSACTVVDLGAVAAAWNVRHAREAGGRGVPLDLCYLNALGPSALLPLIELESRPIAPRFRERVSWTRNLVMDRLQTSQDDWHGWTFRNARRQSEAHRLVAERRLPRFSADVRHCDGRRVVTADFDSRRSRM